MELSEDHHILRWQWEEFVRYARELPGVTTIISGKHGVDGISRLVNGEGKVLTFFVYDRLLSGTSSDDKRGPRWLKNKSSEWLEFLGL